ncbi:MAG: twin-arginine translocase TatA/TatE family subunit [Dehalococcoidia bacterium]
MNGLFGVGPLEIVVIGVLALIFIGPERLPGVIRQVMSTIRDLREYADQLRAELAPSLDELQREMTGAVEELTTAVQDMGQDLTEITTEAGQAIQEADVRPEVSELMAPPPPRDVTEPFSAPSQVNTNGATHDADEPARPSFTDYRPE